MAAPRVSIVIPAYNAAAFIAKTLATVAAQTFTDFEVIVVDDGSSDDTQLVAERFLKDKGLRGRCIRQENKKIAGARNTGIRAAEADLISFLDHDDLWFPDKLARTLAEFDSHPDADLVCHDENIVKDGALVRVSHNGPLAENMYERLLFEGNALSPSAVTVKRSKLLEACFAVRVQHRRRYDLWMRLARIAAYASTRSWASINSSSPPPPTGSSTTTPTSSISSSITSRPFRARTEAYARACAAASV